MNIDSLSLDQIRAVIAVIEEGSFSGAAKRFGRGQPAVSYSIAALEQQLGIKLFDRSGYRPVLTESGAALAGEMAEIISRADRLRTRADAMAKGLEAELSLVCDVMFPLDEMGKILKEFEAEYPTVPIRLYVEVLGGAYDLGGQWNLHDRHRQPVPGAAAESRRPCHAGRADHAGRRAEPSARRNFRADSPGEAAR